MGNVFNKKIDHTTYCIKRLQYTEYHSWEFMLLNFPMNILLESLLFTKHSVAKPKLCGLQSAISTGN